MGFNNSTGYLKDGDRRRLRDPRFSFGCSTTRPFPTAFCSPIPLLDRGVCIASWNDTSSSSLQNAIDVLESVEGMVVRINEPLVTGSTYYNVTGVVADGGLKNGAWSGTFNALWRAPVLDENDFNTELLFVDYQSPNWKTFQPLPQTGDVLADSTGAEVFRGVMDYTADAIYMARPLQLPAPLTGESGAASPSQGWNFRNTSTWYPAAIQTALKTFAAGDRTTVANWRIGAGADPMFKAPWPASEADALTVASFNIELR